MEIKSAKDLGASDYTCEEDTQTIFKILDKVYRGIDPKQFKEEKKTTSKSKPKPKRRKTTLLFSIL